MIGVASMMGVLLAALVGWSASSAEREGATAGTLALRLLAGVGLLGLTVEALRIEAPGAALVAGPIAVALIAGPVVDRARSRRRRVPRARLREAPIPAAPARSRRRAA